jgi:hypothetical protein
MSDRPPLHQLVQEQLEVAAKHIDAKYWHALKAFQIEYVGPETLSPPKTPVLLKNQLTMYAAALFRLEADQYPKGDGKYTAWLRALSQRTTARVMHTVEELQASEGKAKLSYHGLTLEAMRENLQVFFAIVLYEYAGVSLPVTSEPPQNQPRAVLDKPSVAGSNPEIERRAALLAAYKATHNVSSKRIYEAKNSGIHKPEFYRWVRGELPATSAPARNFERFLAAKRAPSPRKPKS